MPKLKTCKGMKKRVRVTKRGKILRRRAGAGHLLSGKSAKRRRKLRRATIVTPGDKRRMIKLLGLG